MTGVAVVVWRRRDGEREWLLLHRAAFDPDFAGDWAWGPPGGGRDPQVPAEVEAARELEEETGLRLRPERTSCGDEVAEIFAAEASPTAEVTLSPEHDRFRWLPLDEACAHCLPARVADQLRCVARELDE